MKRVLSVGNRPALWRRLTAASVLSCAVIAAVPPGAAQAAPVPHDLGAGADGPARTMSKDPNAELAISQAAAAERALPGDSPVEQVDRAIARFKKYHPNYVAPTTTTGAASIADVIAAAEHSRVADAAAAEGTQCAPTWARIELGAVRYRYIRPATNSPHALYGTGVSTADWYNWFLLCRDDRWSPGDYGVYSNLSGKYVYVAPDYVLYAIDLQIYDESNLVRFKHYDSTYQTMITPRYGLWIGVQSQGRLVVANAGVPSQVTAWHKFIVYPPPQSLPCDWAGPAC